MFKMMTDAFCRECGRKDRKHKAFGLCATCYARGYQRRRAKIDLSPQPPMQDNLARL